MIKKATHKINKEKEAGGESKYLDNFNITEGYLKGFELF